jgi:hypothetical protein
LQKRPHAAIDHVVHPWRVFLHPGGIQSTHTKAICQNWPAPMIPTARLRRSANTPQASFLFHEIGGGGGNAGGGVGHSSGDFAGSGDVLRGQDATEFRDQRFLGGGRKALPGATFQSFDLSSPDRLIGRDSQDQRGDSGSQACGLGARATVVDDRAAGGKDGRVVYRADNLNVVERRMWVKSLAPQQINDRSPNCMRAALIIATGSAADVEPACCQNRSKSAVSQRNPASPVDSTKSTGLGGTALRNSWPRRTSSRTTATQG